MGWRLEMGMAIRVKAGHFFGRVFQFYLFRWIVSSFISSFGHYFCGLTKAKQFYIFTQFFFVYINLKSVFLLDLLSHSYMLKILGLENMSSLVRLMIVHDDRAMIIAKHYFFAIIMRCIASWVARSNTADYR